LPLTYPTTGPDHHRFIYWETLDLGKGLELKMHKGYILLDAFNSLDVEHPFQSTKQQMQYYKKGFRDKCTGKKLWPSPQEFFLTFWSGRNETACNIPPRSPHPSFQGSPCKRQDLLKSAALKCNRVANPLSRHCTIWKMNSTRVLVKTEVKTSQRTTVQQYVLEFPKSFGTQAMHWEPVGWIQQTDVLF
jgi:hypothetical protein